MKKIILSLFFILSSLITWSQTYYKATVTEMYMFEKSQNEWQLYQKNSDVNITVVVEEEFISFQAKTPSIYKIYVSTKEPLETKSLKGFRYSAKDLKEEKYVKIDVLVNNESSVAIISIINLTDGYNFRFYLTKLIGE